MSITKIALIQEMLESAEASVRSAKQLVKELAGGKIKDSSKASFEGKIDKLSEPADTERGKVIEGVFDGQNMLGSDQRSYPVPANYASKSKLIPGDVLKLTITDNGAFIYKQIGPIPRKHIIGTLAYEDGQYKVISQGKVYKVLLASVTYFKAEVGDQVAIVVPEFEDSEWAAIENVIPQEALKREMETEIIYNIPEMKEESDDEKEGDNEEEKGSSKKKGKK